MKKKTLFTLLLTAVLTALLLTAILPAAAASPAIQLGSGTTLFISAPGAKSSSVGSLSSVGTTSEALSVATTLDSSRAFSVYETSASTVIGGSLTFTYSGATVGTDEYISAIITDKTGNVLYYGKLKSVSSASGSVSMTVPSLAGETAYDLLLFSEKCTASGDVASAFSSVSLLVYPDPYITSISVPDTTQGVNYSFTLAAESNSSSVKWSIAGGALPNGLSLNSTTGTITGSPTKSGSFSFTVKAAVGSASHTRSYTLTVNPPMTIEFSSNISSGTLTTIEVPQNRTVTLNASVVGGTPSYSQYQWMRDHSSIPGANSLTYKLPTSKLGTFIYTFVATDSARANATASVTVIVRTPIIPTVSATSATYDKHTPSTVSVTKSDGDYPFTGKITIDSKALTEGTDYTLSGNTITLTKALLDSLALGSYNVTLDYADTTSDPTFKLNIIDTSLPPEVGSISTPAPIDRGEVLGLTAPSTTSHGLAITSQGWKIKTVGSTGFVDFDPSSALDCSANGASIYYYATNGVGTTTSNTVIITVNHTILAKWQINATKHWHVCGCGEIFDYADHSCDAAGLCSVCGHKCTHNFTEYASDNNATCTTDGTLTRYCIICNYRDTIVDQNTKMGHKWSIWQLSDTKHWRVCMTCGEKSEEGNHIPGAPATYDTPQTCTICGKILADKLSGGPSVTTPPDSSETTTPPTGTGSDTTPPTGTGTTTTPPTGTGSDTTPPTGTTPATPGSTTTPPEGSDPSSTPDGGDATTTAPSPDSSKAQINIERKPGDTDDENPTFVSDTDLSDLTIITIDGRPLTKDEYVLSENGKEITIKPATPFGSGKHTLVIETETGKGETSFTTKGVDVEEGRRKFPFWLLWVVPHVLADIAGLICIVILATKKKGDGVDDSEDGDDNTSMDLDTP